MSETTEGRYDRLEAARIIATAGRLQLRVTERFPESGLSGVAERLPGITRSAEATCDEISRPRMGLRIGIAVTLVLPDPQVLAAVQEIEALTTGLSRKIWQKLAILHR